MDDKLSLQEMLELGREIKTYGKWTHWNGFVDYVGDLSFVQQHLKKFGDGNYEISVFCNDTGTCIGAYCGDDRQVKKFYESLKSNLVESMSPVAALVEKMSPEAAIKLIRQIID